MECQSLLLICKQKILAKPHILLNANALSSKKCCLQSKSIVDCTEESKDFDEVTDDCIPSAVLAMYDYTNITNTCTEMNESTLYIGMNHSTVCTETNESTLYTGMNHCSLYTVPDTITPYLVPDRITTDTEPKEHPSYSVPDKLTLSASHENPQSNKLHSIVPSIPCHLAYPITTALLSIPTDPIQRLSLLRLLSKAKIPCRYFIIDSYFLQQVDICCRFLRHYGSELLAFVEEVIVDGKLSLYGHRNAHCSIPGMLSRHMITATKPTVVKKEQSKDDKKKTKHVRIELRMSLLRTILNYTNEEFLQSIHLRHLAMNGKQKKSLIQMITTMRPRVKVTIT